MIYHSGIGYKYVYVYTCDILSDSAELNQRIFSDFSPRLTIFIPAFCNLSVAYVTGEDDANLDRGILEEDMICQDPCSSFDR